VSTVNSDVGAEDAGASPGFWGEKLIRFGQIWLDWAKFRQI